MLDVAIIGAGVVGCSIARELSKYELDVTVIEKASDVCEGTSKANSGIAHAGYDAKPGTLKAKLNVRGSQIMEDLSKDLGFLYRRCGSFVLCFDEKDMDHLNELKQRGESNGVKDIRILTASEAKEMEPSLCDSVVGVLYAPTGAIVDPFGLTICMAQNAAVNGVNFMLNSEVTSITKIDGGFEIKCRKQTAKNDTSITKVCAKVVINVAGVYADRIHNMVSDKKIEIIPRRGEYMLLDNTAGSFVGRTIFQLPTKLGKGVLITPTVHGNMLLGPTADDIDDKEDTDTTLEGLASVKLKTALSADNVPYREVITSFSGLRAKLVNSVPVLNLEDEQKEDDFLIGELPDAPGFIDVAGIESPGLTSAPAIGEYVVKLLEKSGISLCMKKDIKTWKASKPFAMSTDEERQAMVKENPLNGNIICRCCTVTEGEIVDAIHQPIGATTSDGIKRRVGAGMGRCQAGFCNPKVVEILSRELGIDVSDVCKNDSGSYYLI